MSKLSDLDLCKKIANIEGLQTHIAMEDNPDAYLWCDDTEQEYDPLTNWSLLGPLMVKYKVNVIHMKTEISGRVELNGLTTFWNSNDKLPRCILECIVEDNK